MTEDLIYWQKVKANALDTVLIAEERIKQLSAIGSGKPKHSKKNRAVSQDVIQAISAKSRQRRLALK